MKLFSLFAENNTDDNRIVLRTILLFNGRNYNKGKDASISIKYSYFLEIVFNMC